MIKTVFFDIGGVLLNLHPDDMGNYWVEKSGVPGDEIKNRFPWERFYLFEKGKINGTEFYQSFLNAMPDGVHISEGEFFEGWSRMVGKETDTVKTLETISKTIPTWLLSNTNPVHIESKAPVYSFLKHTSGEIYSYDVGCRKPDPEIYHAAINAVGNAPEECLFIDDMEENILAARKIGMDGIVYTSAEELDLMLIEKGLLNG